MRNLKRATLAILRDPNQRNGERRKRRVISGRGSTSGCLGDLVLDDADLVDERHLLEQGPQLLLRHLLGYLPHEQLHALFSSLSPSPPLSFRHSHAQRSPSSCGRLGFRIRALPFSLSPILPSSSPRCLGGGRLMMVIIILLRGATTPTKQPFYFFFWFFKINIPI